MILLLSYKNRLVAKQKDKLPDGKGLRYGLVQPKTHMHHRPLSRQPREHRKSILNYLIRKNLSGQQPTISESKGKPYIGNWIIL